MEKTEKEKRKQKQGHNYKEQRRNGTMEEEIKEIKLMVMEKRRTSLGVWILQAKCGRPPLEELSTLTR